MGVAGSRCDLVTRDLEGVERQVGDDPIEAVGLLGLKLAPHIQAIVVHDTPDEVEQNDYLEVPSVGCFVELTLDLFGGLPFIAVRTLVRIIIVPKNLTLIQWLSPPLLRLSAKLGS